MTIDKHDQHNTQPLLCQFSPRKKTGGGEGIAYYKFWLIVGRLFEGGYMQLYCLLDVPFSLDIFALKIEYKQFKMFMQTSQN